MKKILDKNIYFIVVCVISFLIFGLYYWYIAKNVDSEKWNVSITFLSTLLSIIVGAAISCIIYDYQKDVQERERLVELLKCLSAELSDLKRVLANGEGLKVNNLTFIVTYIQPIIIDECAKSALFTPDNIENFIHVSRKIKLYWAFVDYLLRLLAAPKGQDFEALLQHCHTNMETSRNAILSDIEFLTKKLDVKLSDSLNAP